MRAEVAHQSRAVGWAVPPSVPAGEDRAGCHGGAGRLLIAAGPRDSGHTGPAQQGVVRRAGRQPLARSTAYRAVFSRMSDTREWTTQCARAVPAGPIGMTMDVEDW